jgi:hypothetical protein
VSYELPPAFRAMFDRGLSEAVDGMLAKAAERDGLDVIEANVDLAHELVNLMTADELATVAAALAIRMRRVATDGLDTGDRYGRCRKCGSVCRWWPAEGQWPGRWQHLDLDAWGAVDSHRAEVAE